MHKILIFFSTILVGCCSAKVAAPSSASSDSTVVRVEYRVEKVVDTVYIEIPKIIERVKRDTMSHLENEYAYSDAIVKGGNLYHKLATIPQKKAVEVETKIEYRDSIIEKIIEKEIVNTIEVEKPDTWWEQTQKKCFWVFLVLILARIAAIVRKLFAL